MLCNGRLRVCFLELYLSCHLLTGHVRAAMGTRQRVSLLLVLLVWHYETFCDI